MAVVNTVITRKYYKEYINGSAFGSNLGVYSSQLTGNSGELVQVVKEIMTGIIANEDESIDIEFIEIDATYCKLKSSSIHWGTEGFSSGDVVTVSWASGASSVTSQTVITITGAGSTELVFAKAAFVSAGLSSGDIQNFVVKVTANPTSLEYKYGLVPPSSAPSFNSFFDTNTNAFRAFGITGSYSTMNPVGAINSYVLGEVEIKYDSTSDYLHFFTLKHTFRIPTYLDGEETNLSSDTVPARLNSINTYKYVDSFTFGFDLVGASSLIDNSPDSGNVGYFNENFNGNASNYEIQTVAYSNASGLDTIEITETNTVTFQIKNNLGAWSGGENLIFLHQKLPTSSEYADKTDTYDEIWLTDTLTTTEGALAASSTIITNCTAAINGGDNTLIDVSYDISYTSGQQTTMGVDAKFLLTVSVATQNLTFPDVIDLVNLKIYGVSNYNTDVSGLITNQQPTFYPMWDNYVGQLSGSDINGWDGDYWGSLWAFDLDATKEATILDPAEFIIRADDGSGNTFDICKKNVPIINPVPMISNRMTPPTSAYSYQIINGFNDDNVNLPSGDEMRKIGGTSPIPAPSTTVQNVRLKVPFQVCWRDWVLNPSIPSSFYDDSEPQDNLNFKTSNYSNVSGYDIYAVLRLRVKNNVFPNNPTIYEIYSDVSDINDFDVAGAVAMTATHTYYDEIGDVTSNIFISENVRIEIDFAHSLGTISPQTLRGVIWIEKDQKTENPWFLSSTQDYTDTLNPLQPTDTLLTGNTQYVEIDSTLNNVKLICQTNKSNLVEGETYNIYGRLYYR